MYAVQYVVVWIVTDILWDLYAKLMPLDYVSMSALGQSEYAG